MNKHVPHGHFTLFTVNRLSFCLGLSRRIYNNANYQHFTNSLFVYIFYKFLVNSHKDTMIFHTIITCSKEVTENESARRFSEKMFS